MARYGQAFKDKAVARLLPPESAAVETVSRELSISTSTLERWRSDALTRPARERAWSAAARFEAVLLTAAMDEAGKSAWCREKGVYPQELEQWRTAATHALDDPERIEQISHRQRKADRHRIKALERDLRRKEKALAEAAALLVLSKKLEAIFPKDKDEDA
jgi:transposase-like protein